MGVAGGVIIFLVWWWVVFLAVLPCSVRGRWESPDDGVKGAEPGAPVRPDLQKKIFLATKITAVLWIITVFAIQADFFDFKNRV